TTDFLGGADDHRLHDLTLLHLGLRNALLHGDDDAVADGRVLPPRTIEDLDAEHLPRPAVVRHIEHGLGLNHVGTSVPTSASPAPSFRTRIACTAQRLSCDSGRLSMIRTRSPTWHSFFSSCAL